MLRDPSLLDDSQADPATYAPSVLGHSAARRRQPTLPTTHHPRLDTTLPTAAGHGFAITAISRPRLYLSSSDRRPIVSQRLHRKSWAMKLLSSISAADQLWASAPNRMNRFSVSRRRSGETMRSKSKSTCKFSSSLHVVSPLFIPLRWCRVGVMRKSSFQQPFLPARCNAKTPYISLNTANDDTVPVHWPAKTTSASCAKPS